MRAPSVAMVVYSGQNALIRPACLEPNTLDETGSALRLFPAAILSLRESRGFDAVVLCGRVFQNELLLSF